MNKDKFTKGTPQFLKLPILSTLTLAFALQFALTGCASIDRQEESVDAILAKENVLIEKVKLERAQPQVSAAVQQSDSLMKAEAHLALALDEIMKANEVVTMKEMKQTEKEVFIERHEASSR